MQKEHFGVLHFLKQTWVTSEDHETDVITI